MRQKISAVLAGFLLCVVTITMMSCAAFTKKQQAGAVVEVNGHYLYRSTLDALTVGLSSEDSLRVAQQYITQWAKDALLFDKAKSRTTPEMEELVEDYRRTLYMHAYEEYLVDRKMSKTISDSMALQIYAQMPDRFVLNESIVKGLMVVVPNDAPTIAKLRKWLEKKSLDNIEKYAYQNANGYELFTDRWLTTTDIITHMPIERADLETKLKSNNQIEVTDSLKTYLLQVNEKHLRGEQMPLEYARPQIEKIVLSARQVEFLQKERERLYNEAIQSGRIKFYE
ncbi:MAG: hypothetical protein K6F10_05115 [Paludibacteraceae bacterium]|nr:hypothetical protein [Paludibacteraceae bacterium]